MGWSTRRIAFAAILVAVTVVLTVLIITLNPLFSVPTFKNPLIGLPVKITSFLFGGILGAIVAIGGDLISFMMSPTFYHPYYTLTLVVIAIGCALVGSLYRFLINVPKLFLDTEFIQQKITLLNPSSTKFQKLNHKLTKRLVYLQSKDSLLLKLRLEKHTFNLLLFITFIFIVVSISMVALFVLTFNPHDLEHTFFRTRIFFFFFSTSGNWSMFFFLVLTGTLLQIPQLAWLRTRVLKFFPIIAFSSILDFLANYLVTLADSKIFGGNFYPLLFSHFIITPFRIWFNIVVLSISLAVIGPIVSERNWLEKR